jgi:hypothetical protein
MITVTINDPLRKQPVCVRVIREGHVEQCFQGTALDTITEQTRGVSENIVMGDRNKDVLRTRYGSQDQDKGGDKTLVATCPYTWYAEKHQDVVKTFV